MGLGNWTGCRGNGEEGGDGKREARPQIGSGKVQD